MKLDDDLDGLRFHTALDEMGTVGLGDEARRCARERSRTQRDGVGGCERRGVGRSLGSAREHHGSSHGHDRDDEHDGHRDQGQRQDRN